MKIVLIYVGDYYYFCALVKIHNSLDRCDDDHGVDRDDVVMVLLLALVGVYRNSDHVMKRKGEDEAEDDEAEGGLFVEAM